MVAGGVRRWERPAALSVLALSSRFDGPGQQGSLYVANRAFSTRSVESF